MYRGCRTRARVRARFCESELDKTNSVSVLKCRRVRRRCPQRRPFARVSSSSTVMRRQDGPIAKEVRRASLEVDMLIIDFELDTMPRVHLLHRHFDRHGEEVVENRFATCSA